MIATMRSHIKNNLIPDHKMALPFCNLKTLAGLASKSLTPFPVKGVLKSKKL